MKTKIVQGERKCKLVCNLPSRRLFKALPKIVQAGRNPKFFCGLLAVVRRGPQGFLHYLAAKSTKNSPTVAFACFVPANVRDGRLFAGAHAPRPRFLPLLAGISFNSSGIESESCAANGGVREGAPTGSETQNPAIAPGSGLNRRIIACSGERTTESPRARSGRLAKASAGEGRQLAVCRAATA